MPVCVVVPVTPEVPLIADYGRGAAVLQGDARRLLLPDESVDLIVTSPPYFRARSYRDNGQHFDGQIGAEPTTAAFLLALREATAEMVRVLKPTGSIWVNLGDKHGPDKSLMGLPWRYGLDCIDRLGLLLRSEVIWSRPNGLPGVVKDRVQRTHEQWFHLTKTGDYFADIDAVREPYNPDTYGRGRRVEKVTDSGRCLAYGRENSAIPTTYRELKAHPLGKLPGSVWTVAPEPLRVPESVDLPKHFAPFPSIWPLRIISGWSPMGGVVLDPFGGTGTVAMVARELGRFGISLDASGDYCRLARWRIFESDGGAKAVAKAVAKGLLRVEEVAA